MKLKLENRTSNGALSGAQPSRHNHLQQRGRVHCGSRRVTRPNLIPRNRIQAYCDAVAGEFHPEKIILFGSYAYGRPTADSDVDLLVILPFRGSDVRKAIQIRARFDSPFPLDLLVRKPAFIAE